MRGGLALLVLLAASLVGCGAVERALVDRVVATRRADAGLVAHEVTVGGRPVAYLDRPGSGAPLVLVHGFGTKKESWIAFVAALPEGRRVLAPDLAGHGDSPADSAAYSPARYAADLGAWLDALGVSAVHVVGNSMGGEVAVLLARQRPEAVRSLALLDPAGLRSPVPSRLDSLIAQGDNPLIPTTRAEYDRMLSLTTERDPGLPGPARDVFAAEAAARAPFLRRLFATLRATPDALADVLPGIEAPALVVWGAEDRVLDPSAGPRWVELLPDAHLVVLPGVGHGPMLEAPAETARLVADSLPPDG